MKRLQGDYFKKVRSQIKLEMLGYMVTSRGHIKAIMRKKGSTIDLDGPTRYLYSHYLSDEETERFKKSEYYKTHEPLSSELVYSNHFKRNRKLQPDNNKEI